jgi:hypothetical protein
LLDLPSVGVAISQLSSVDANCEAVSASPLDGHSPHIFPNLTHIAPTVAIDVALDATAAINIPGFSDAKSSSIQLAGTTFTLPTACLSFNAANSAFVPPTVSTTSPALTSGILGPTASPNATAADVGGQKANAVLGRAADNPFGKGAIAAGKGLWYMVTALVTVFAVAITL